MRSQRTLLYPTRGSLLQLLLILTLLSLSVSHVNAFLVESLVILLRSGQRPTCLQGTSTATSTATSLGNESGEWLKHGILMSSFSDGLKPNPQAVDFLMRGLVASLWREHGQRKSEEVVKESALQSPCCGPDVDALMSMELVDTALVDLEEGRMPWKDVLNDLVEGTVDGSLELRFLYIPTAMYALRKDSTHSPGTQRQRARADGRKRRNELVDFLSSQFEGKIPIRTVTLDLDDSSIKQPDGHDFATTIPKDGIEAFQFWKPNLVYVQGGNTFWLYHCIEKGRWGPHILNACTGDDAAVYCGTSAGAIIMGQSMATACWKQWDDPSLVPNRGSYDDWKDVSGFRLVGPVSFFPHMNDTWQTLVRQKMSQYDDNHTLLALRDDEVCCVRGGHVKVLRPLCLRNEEEILTDP